MNIYVEVTHTERSSASAGIQRVVRNILANLIRMSTDSDIRVFPVVFENDEFYITSVDAVLRFKATPTSPQMVKWIDRPDTLQQKRILPWLVLINRCLISAGLRRRTKRSAADRLTTRLEQLPGRNVLLLLDASWHLKLWPEVKRLKKRGVVVIGTVYDLIPINHPEAIAGSRQDFKNWLKRCLITADGIVGISKTTLTELKHYIATCSDCARTLPAMLPFYLGAELDFVRISSCVQDSLKSLKLQRTPIFLMVGTIAPHKNHRQVLEAFKLLWAEGIVARLVIVAKHSWKSDELLADLKGHPAYGRDLILLQNGSDADVSWLYQNCSALIMASISEGFGLPIVEARLHGLPALCSDIPIFRELATAGTTLFRLHDPDDLAQTIRGFLAQPTPVRPVAGWITWEESVRQLLTAIQHIVASAPVTSRRCE